MNDVFDGKDWILPYNLNSICADPCVSITRYFMQPWTGSTKSFDFAADHDLIQHYDYDWTFNDIDASF